MNYKSLENKYTPIIQKIIDDNKKFYGFESAINWQFFVDQDVRLIATANSKLELRINIISVDYAYQKNEPFMIEFFILHEIRHLYQRYCAYLLEKDNCPPNIQLATIYKSEFANYCNIYKNREVYYTQQVEFEAFIFSYAVMRYKYGDIKYIKYPEFYDEQNIDVKKHIEYWFKIFKAQNL